MLEGLTLVISPLIALMKDQLDFLVARDVPAARLDSSLDRDETLKVYDDLNAGRLKLLYISPERLGNERFLHSLQRRNISLLAVDEAHCISEWGHNFRPDYLKMARMAQELKVDRVLALTATATPDVARDIAVGFGAKAVQAGGLALALRHVSGGPIGRANMRSCKYVRQKDLWARQGEEREV